MQLITFKIKFLAPLIMLIFLSFQSFSQQKNDSIVKKKNTIFFADVNLGYAYFSEHALSGGLSLNYQKKNNLFKFRFIQNEYIQKIKLFLNFIPIEKTSVIYNEHSILYGKRIMKDNHSIHFAIGVSYNYLEYVEKNHSILRDYFWGVPLEIGFLSFNKNKEQYRVFGMIPVGKPTSFSRSAGLKIVANLAHQSYVGLNLTLGFGWYKKYK